MGTKLTELVRKDAINAQLSSTDRDTVLNELLDMLVECGAADAAHREDLMAYILDREAKGSTGFGRGVAIPHVKHESIRDMAAAVGVSQEGIDFNALDKQPVYSVILLLSPASDPESHLRAMEAVFTHLSKDSFRRFLRQAESADDVMTLLDDADNQRLPS